MLKIYDITLDYNSNPDLLNLTDIRFAWKIESATENVKQTSYRVQIEIANSLFFDSGIVESSQSYNVVFDNLILPSGVTGRVIITITDNCENTASNSLNFSTMPSPDIWESAKWIKPSQHISGWAPYMRTKFSTENISSAVMYACGLGCAEYYINGTKTDDYYIDPPISNYTKTVYYRRFDVTNLMKDGGNCLCVLLGEGFYSQSRVWGQKGFVYGDVCASIVLIITHKDGTQTQIVTDTDNWTYKYSPITVNNIYAGEVYDCRLETPCFADYESSDDGWLTVIEDTTPKGQLTPCRMPPVRIIRTLSAQSVECASGKFDGAWIFDMGENVAGFCEFHLPPSPRGAVYVFRYTETLNEGGNADHRSVGAFATQCIQQDIYIARGEQDGEVYRPRFCYHGFRYIELTGLHDFTDGYGTVPRAEMMTCHVLSTDMQRAGSFKTTHNDLNRLHNIMDNTFRSNYHGVPEDCPAREKCGWLGDAQVVVNWGLYNYNSVSSYEKYLHDIRTTKQVCGTWQMISPGKRGCGEASPLWGCAQIIIPYYLYKYYGDEKAITNNWDLMTQWIQHELDRSKDYIISEGLGDWCPPGDKIYRMPLEHSSTLIFYEISRIMEELSQIFHRENVAYYKELADKIKESMISKFYNYDKNTFGYHGSDGVALAIGMYPDGKREMLLDSLISSLKENDYAMYTGIYANKYLVPALFESGKGDDALNMLFNRNKTSFATMMDEGATSFWEDLEMKSAQPRSSMAASYNHPMHGGFMYFCHNNLAGFVPVEPGFRLFKFKPCIAKQISEYAASYNSIAGLIEMTYKKTEKGHEYTLKVPANCSCILDLPVADTICVNNISCLNGKILGSGKYTIICQ